MIELRSNSPEETRCVASAIGRVARPGDLIVIAGQMGAGKTVFAQGFARSLGVHEPVTSPTYTLIHSYQTGAATLHHADLYRLEHTTEVADLGLAELLDDDSIVLVEWGDVVDLGPHLRVELRIDDADAGADDDDGDAERRAIAITSSDKRWALRWPRLEVALQEWLAT